MKSRLPALVAASTALVTIAGCAGSTTPGSAGEDVTLEFQTGIAASAPTLDALREISAVCEPEGVRVDLIPQTNTYEADMKARLASADVPDLWATHGWSLLRYREFLEPLDGRAWASKVNPALDPAMRDDDGGLFALPINTDVAGIVYNERVVAEAGIDLAELTNWDAFSEALAAIAATGKTPLAASSKDAWMSGNVADFMASGAHDEDAREKLLAGTFPREDYAAMLEQIEHWADEGFFNPDFTAATLDDIARGVAQEEVGFVFVQNYFVATVLGFAPDAEVGYFPIPSFQGEPYFAGGEGTAFGVSATSAHKQEALEYLDCLAEPENLGRLAGAVGGIPGLTNATSDLGPLQSSYDRWVKDDAFPLEPYFDRVYLPNGMWDTMVTTTTAVIAGQNGVPEAVDQMEQQFTSMFGRP